MERDDAARRAGIRENQREFREQIAQKDLHDPAVRLEVDPQLRLAEDMHGSVTTAQGPKPLSVALDIAVPDMYKFVHSKDHTAQVTGYVEAPHLGGHLKITDGTFRLFRINPKTHEREMRYQLSFVDKENKAHQLDGTKYVSSVDSWRPYRDLTQLHVTVDGTDKGIIKLSPRDIWNLARSATLPSEHDWGHRIETVKRFVKFALTSVYRAYLKPKHTLSGT